MLSVESSNPSETAAPAPLQDAIASSGFDDLRPRATFEVEGGRAIVNVYASEESAAAYDLAPRARVLRVRNIVGTTVRGTLSTRLRRTLRGLR